LLLDIAERLLQLGLVEEVAPGTITSRCWHQSAFASPAVAPLPGA
jgi:hypothetical protein